LRLKGEVVVEVDGRESRSFIQNLGKALWVIMASPGVYPDRSGPVTSTTVVKPDGTSGTIYGEWYAGTVNAYCGGGTSLGMKASAGDDTLGIQVGTSSTPVTSTDYRLPGKISHGTGSGQLQYGDQSVTYSYGSTYGYVELTRVFTNSSGASIVVREVGLIARNYWKDQSGIYIDVKFLIARDVLEVPVTVPSMSTVAVRYRLSLSV
jgi:hypothetical protein